MKQKYTVIGRITGGPSYPYIRTNNHKVAYKALEYCKTKYPEYVWTII